MKANRRPIQRMRDAAEVGVGTLIVFIAMVLVAAVAAAVLIGTSGRLQNRAMSTGEAATQEVSGNLLVHGVYGNQTSQEIGTLKIHVTLAAGSMPIDLTNMKLRFSNLQEVPVYLDYSSTTTTSSAYNLTWVRGSTTNGEIEQSDLVEVRVDLYKLGSGYKISPRENIELRLIPESGATIRADFTAPNNFAGDTHVTLR